MTERHRDSPLWPGAPLALGSAVLFGAAAPLSKLLLGVVDPGLLAGLLYLGAGVGLALLHFGRKFVGLASVERPLRRGDLPWLAAAIGVGGVLGPLLLMLGLARTTASAGSLLLNLESLATMAIAWVVLRENVDRRLLIGALAILMGAVLLAWDGQGVRLDLGGLLIAGACVAWGIDNNLTRRLSGGDPVEIAMLKGLVAGAVNLGLALYGGATLPGPGPIAGGAVVGFFGIGISLVLYMLGLRHLGTARTGAYFALAPFIGALLSLPLLHEPATPALVGAGSLMALGLWLHLSERHAHAHTHEPLVHEHLHVHDAHHQHAHDGPVSEPHSHPHRHERLSHTHVHYPDLHHRHTHG